jgi:hypothetical protein
VRSKQEIADKQSQNRISEEFHLLIVIAGVLFVGMGTVNQCFLQQKGFMEPVSKLQLQFLKAFHNA